MTHSWSLSSYTNWGLQLGTLAPCEEKDLEARRSLQFNSGHLGKGNVGPSELQRKGATQAARELARN